MPITNHYRDPAPVATPTAPQADSDGEVAPHA
jgi:hypothetical protein